jgi:hypothetical protein
MPSCMCTDPPKGTQGEFLIDDTPRNLPPISVTRIRLLQSKLLPSFLGPLSTTETERWGIGHQYIAIDFLDAVQSDPGLNFHGAIVSPPGHRANADSLGPSVRKGNSRLR